jgi:heme/copper-type cytochrome/quinol oxidase subunit 2
MPIAVHVVNEKEYSAWLDMAKKKFATDDDARPNPNAVATANGVK